MSLDYTAGCVNFRDVGEFVNLLINEEVLPTKRIYRGGKTDFVDSITALENPATIINLRNGPDKKRFGADYFHFPISKHVEKYDTSLWQVRDWLNNIIKQFENPELKYPVFIHCLSGKDRTGIVVGTLLTILGIKRAIIIEEYLLSDEVDQLDMFKQALDMMGNVENYLNRVDLEKVRQNILDTNKDEDSHSA